MNIALCIRGGVSGKYSTSTSINSIYDHNKYINYYAVYNSIKKHIIDSNKNIYIDTFLHSWNFDLESQLVSLYNPKSYLFEDNRIYNSEILLRCKHPEDFAGISQALSFKKVIEIKENYEIKYNIKYDFIILYRPDVIILTDLVLSNYHLENNTIYVNAHPDCNGDFHFIMSSDSATKFKGLYDSALIDNPHILHFWIKNYVTKSLGLNLLMDSIIPGLHQEVARPDKINTFSIGRFNVNKDTFYSYGMTESDFE